MQDKIDHGTKVPKRRGMETLQIYTRKFDINEIADSACFGPFERTVKEFHLHHAGGMDLNRPSLFLIRFTNAEGHGEAYQEWVNENHETLWNFLDKLKSRNKCAAVILFIQERSFELLYRAVKAHVDEVILEPEDSGEITERIAGCTRRLLALCKQREERRRLEEYEFNKRQKIMERLLQYLLDKPEDVDYLLPEINRRYGTKLNASHYQAITITVDQFELYNKDSRFLREISLLMIHQLENNGEIILGEVDPFGLIAIVNYPEDCIEPHKREELEELRRQITQMQDTYGRFEVTIAVGPMVEQMKDIRTSLNGAMYVSEYRMAEPGQVLYAKEHPGVTERLDRFLSNRSIRELCRYVALGDMEHIEAWFEHFYRETEPKFQEYPPAYAQFCWQMHGQVRKMEKASRIRNFPDMRFFALQHVFDGHERMKELQLLLLEISHMMQNELSDEHELASHAIAYMKVHYAEPVNLETIAEHCGFSTSYFSRKFKEQTGENYIDVLTEIRMKKAQQLLRDTDIGIEQIIEQTGYYDDKHFRKLFARQTGMTPSEYRRLEKEKRPSVAK